MIDSLILLLMFTIQNTTTVPPQIIQAPTNYGALTLTIVAALIAGVPPTLAAIAAYKQSMAALLAAQKNTALGETVLRKTDVQAIKTDELSHQVQEVHTLTNSNLAAVKAELAAAAVRIEGLIAVVAELKTERGKAQIREALHTQVPITEEPNRRADTPTAKQQLDVQRDIARNTAETAEHTAGLIRDGKGE